MCVAITSDIITTVKGWLLHLLSKWPVPSPTHICQNHAAPSLFIWAQACPTIVPDNNTSAKMPGWVSHYGGGNLYPHLLYYPHPKQGCLEWTSRYFFLKITLLIFVVSTPCLEIWPKPISVTGIALYLGVGIGPSWQTLSFFHSVTFIHSGPSRSLLRALMTKASATTCPLA